MTITITRGHRYELHRNGRTLSVDTKSPGTDLRYAPHAQWSRWRTEGWAHFTISDDSRRWGERGKVIHNGAFEPLPMVQCIVRLFEAGHWDAH